MQRKVAVIGLGFVGLTIATEFGKKMPIIGYDISQQRIEELQHYQDITHTVSEYDLQQAQITFTHDTKDLQDCNFYIITVPTPLNNKQEPDLSILLNTSAVIAAMLKPGDIIVYESSVYPGATEECCIPALERGSALKCCRDFGVAFSPERVNPGDKVHTLATIKKIIAATDSTTLAIVRDIYSKVIQAGFYETPNIKTAEAAKLIENVQRDVNVAYLNEVAIILHKMGLDITSVLKAMRTKWNALDFAPGLVGGHCISVNSQYLSYMAKSIHANASLIINARHINSAMPDYIANQTVQQLNELDIAVQGAKIAILGITFKENCPDLKDSQVINVISAFRQLGAQIIVHDPIADPSLAYQLYGIELVPLAQILDVEAIIVAVAHTQFHDIEKELIAKITGKGLIVDIKGILHLQYFNDSHVNLWQI